MLYGLYMHYLAFDVWLYHDARCTQHYIFLMCVDTCALHAYYMYYMCTCMGMCDVLRLVKLKASKELYYTCELVYFLLLVSTFDFEFEPSANTCICM